MSTQLDMVHYWNTLFVAKYIGTLFTQLFNSTSNRKCQR